MSRWPNGEFEVKDIPATCPECGGLVKTDTVMFGEPIPRNVLERCFEESERSDCMIVVGTSATVTPAASLPLIVRQNAGRLIEMNIRESEITYACDVNVFAPSGESLPLLVEEIEDII